MWCLDRSSSMASLASFSETLSILTRMRDDEVPLGSARRPFELGWEMFRTLVMTVLLG